MKKKLHIYVLFLLFFFSGELNSQVLPFRIYNVRDGLISNYITSFTQDSRGYMWISTDEGFSVYDGKVFQNYILNDTVSWGFVNSMYESRFLKNTMWIGMNGGGLLQFSDGRLIQHQLGTTISSHRVNAVMEDTEGKVWCGTDDGIFIFQDGIVTQFKPEEHFTPINKIVKDSLDVLWFVSETAMYRYSMHTSKFEKVQLPIKNLRTTFVTLFALHDGTVALSTMDKHVYILRDTVIQKTFYFPDGIPIFILEDEEKYFWIGTTNGLWHIERNDTTLALAEKFGIENGLHVKDFSTGFMDREGVLWIGSYGKGFAKLEEKRNMRLLVSDINARGGCDAFGRIWAGTGAGVAEVWKDGSQKWHQHIHSLVIDGKIKIPAAVCLLDSGELWIGFPDGTMRKFIIHYNKDSFSRVEYAHISVGNTKQFPRSTSVFFLVDSKKRLWYSVLDSALIVVDVRARPKLLKVLTEKDGLPTIHFGAIYEDRNNNIWVGGWDRYVAKISTANNIFGTEKIFSSTNGLPEGGTRAFFHDVRGRMWFGMRYGGLVLCENNVLTTYTVSNGLLSNQIWAMTESKDSTLWIGTQSGLAYLEHGDVLRMKSNQKLTESPLFSLGIHPSGFLWGMTRFEIAFYEFKGIKQTSASPPVYITNFSVNGKSHSLTANLQFPYNQNNCTIDFAGVSMRSDPEIHYQYKLEGSDNEWHGPISSRSVTYAGLKPGTYTFFVRTSTGKNISNTVAASIVFTIIPPFWQQWWFIGLVIALVAGIILLSERMRVSRLVEIEKIRSHIAADLHDDIGSGLTRIALLSEIMHTQSLSQSNNEKGNFSITQSAQKVGHISRELVDAMSDVVWAIDPKNSSMEKLLQRVHTFATEICEAKDIQLQFSVSENLEKMKVGSDVLRCVLLVIKEATTNLARHSMGTEAVIAIRKIGLLLDVTIADNGKGCDLQSLSRINGITNMRIRTEKKNGVFTITSKSGEGTRVHVQIPLHT